MSYARRFTLATLAACATLLLIAVFLHTFLCEWGSSSHSRPAQMTLVRLGPVALFVRHAGYYPRTGIVLVGVVIPLILIVWATWLYLGSGARLGTAVRRGRGGDRNRYRPHEDVEYMSNESREAVPACVARLGLELPCTLEEVKTAFRQQSKAVHPDRGGDNDAFILLRTSYEQAVDYVSRYRPRHKSGRVARLDPARRPAPQARRGARRKLRWVAVAMCVLLASVMGLSSRWTAVYHSRDGKSWFAVGAGAIEFISLDADPRVEQGWSVDEHDEPFVWRPIAAGNADGRWVAIPLWTLLLALAAPTVLLWRRGSR